MQSDPKALLRGLAKFVAVVVAAGLAGAGLGIALAKLSGNGGGATAELPVAASATTATPTATPPPETTTTAGTQTTAPETATYRAPRVEILSALIGPVSPSTGRALIAARVRVTNRGRRPLVIEAPALLSGRDEVALNESKAPNPLIRTVTPGANASGMLRFTLSPEITQRLNANLAARLRIARRTILLKLTKG